MGLVLLDLLQDMYGHLMEGDSPLMDSSSGSGAGQHAAIDSSRDAVFAPVRTLLSRLDSTAASSPEALRSRQQVLKRLQSMQSVCLSLFFVGAACGALVLTLSLNVANVCENCAALFSGDGAPPRRERNRMYHCPCCFCETCGVTDSPIPVQG